MTREMTVFDWQTGVPEARERGLAALKVLGFDQDDIRRAVSSWQHSAGLPVTGVLTTDTWGQLLAAADAKNTEPQKARKRDA